MNENLKHTKTPNTNINPKYLDILTAADKTGLRKQYRSRSDATE